MKKMIFSFFSGLLMLTILSGCKGDAGPAGPAGATGAPGATGATGAPGATGSVNVTYSNWINVTFSNTGVEWQGTINAPGVTQTIIDRGIVNVYLRNPENLVIPLNYSVTGHYIHFHLIPGSIVIRSSYNATYPYRYVIIPGSISGGRFSSGPAVGYSLESIKKMTYEQITRLFNIPAEGESKKK